MKPKKNQYAGRTRLDTVIVVKVSKTHKENWTKAANESLGDGSLSEWIRTACEDKLKNSN